MMTVDRYSIKNELNDFRVTVMRGCKYLEDREFRNGFSEWERQYGYGGHWKNIASAKREVTRLSKSIGWGKYEWIILDYMAEGDNRAYVYFKGIS